MKVKTISVTETIDSINPGLTPNKDYFVIGIEDEYYRIVNDDGEPILYPKFLFRIIDRNYPDEWIEESYGEGEYTIQPPEFANNYFYEDYFDGDSKAIKIFKQYCKIHSIPFCKK